GTTFSGGIAVAMGSSGEYASFDEFKKNWSKARLSLVKKKSGLALSLRGVRPALRIRAPDGRKRHPVIYVSGKRLETDTLECSHARQSQRGHPVEVENFRIDSDGRPVTAYSSPDGSSCVVLQPLPVPVDLNITSPTGKVRVKGLRLGRIELDSSSRSLRVESCSPIGGLSTTGQLRGLKEIVKCWSGRTAMPAIQDIEGS
ncbi:MAG: hypothetical protein QF473_32375, partial [Planctomycetota bacterium]|nr:hypothetical protein [Planctomycetota bacterium]